MILNHAPRNSISPAAKILLAATLLALPVVPVRSIAKTQAASSSSPAPATRSWRGRSGSTAIVSTVRS